VDPRFDTVIVGAGLAGACAARILAKTRRVLLVDAGDHDAASPAAVAALANPLMAQRARPGWRVVDALDAYERLVGDLDLTDPLALAGLVRPAATSRQAEEFAEVAGGYPELATWWTPGETLERAPWIDAPHGTLQVIRGGAVSVPDLLESLRRAAVREGAEYRASWVLEGWAVDAGHLEAVFRTEAGAVRARAGAIVLATGPGFGRLPALRDLSLHLVKGQLVRVRPFVIPTGVLPVSGRGYAVPNADGTVVIGSSYEHDFDDSAPTRIQSRRLLARMLPSLPWLREATVVSESAGLRVTVPGRRIPMAGPLPADGRIWLLTGLGSKGLLMAPYLAERLPGWMDEPGTIPAELRVA
jgi:glycine/D-amino acid oxidase-like deaminating enzyme